MNRSKLLACGTVILILTTAYLAFGFATKPMTLSARRASGGNDLFEPWSACREYAVQHEGSFPPLDPEPGRLMFDRHIMSNEYGVTGRTVTMEYDASAPASWIAYQKDPLLAQNKDLIDDHSWWYLGYVITNEDEAEVFLTAYLEQVMANHCFAPDQHPSSADEKLKRLHLSASHLKTMAARQDIQDAALAQIPVFIERPGHYAGYSGGWVMYLDGHSEFIDYPGRFPMTTRVIGMLRLIDALGPVYVTPEK